MIYQQNSSFQIPQFVLDIYGFQKIVIQWADFIMCLQTYVKDR